jgi:folate-dependent phosphoribosylglycinamide formyltransferase PurN
MKVVVLAPVDSSPFALAAAELSRREPGMELAGIVVRRILDLQRLRSELRRDGVRLLRKAWRKLVIQAAVEEGSGPHERGFYDVVEELGLERRSLRAFAERHAVPYLKVADHNDPTAVDFVRRLAPDVVAFTGGGLIRGPLLEAAGQGILNAHMGILPTYRGMDVVEWPILEERHDDVGIGVTLHFIDTGVDTGPIVATRRVPLRAGDGIERLRTRFEPVMVDLLLEGMRQVRDGTLAALPQEPRAGRQYFLMHPRLYERVRIRLASLSASAAPAEDASRHST